VYCFMCEQSEFLDNYDEVIEYWKCKCDLNIVYFDQSDALKINTMSNLSKSIKSDSFFNGIRAEESKQRRISLRKYSRFHRMKSTGKTRIAPLAWWKQKDIMSYMFLNELPFLDTYLKLGGGSRTGTFLPNANADNLRNALKSLKLKSISDYNKILIKYPNLTEIANV